MGQKAAVVTAWSRVMTTSFDSPMGMAFLPTTGPGLPSRSVWTAIQPGAPEMETSATLMVLPSLDWSAAERVPVTVGAAAVVAVVAASFLLPQPARTSVARSTTIEMWARSFIVDLPTRGDGSLVRYLTVRVPCIGGWTVQ